MMELPIPKSWQEFETIVRDAQAQRWKTTTLQKTGVQGKSNKASIFSGRMRSGVPLEYNASATKRP
jgi:hypothetical protein